MERTIKIGTRASKLALWQAEHVQRVLKSMSCKSEIIKISTQGDRRQEERFDKLEGKGFFTKELEEALLDGSVDLAVHSFKDMPTLQPEGLCISALSSRENPADWLVIDPTKVDKNQSNIPIAQGARVGTSSARRKSQLEHWRPDLEVIPIRGNVPTRMARVGNDVDAVVLAAAGITRLELQSEAHFIHPFKVQKFIPAPAQGVLALQTRTTDDELNALMQQISNKQSEETVGIERSLLAALDGGCQQPIGIHCFKTEKEYHVWCSTGNSTGIRRNYFSASTKDAVIEQAIPILKADDKKKRVFISRSLSSESYFKKHLTAQGHEVFDESLIEISMVSFEEYEKTDWIFFSSKNGVRNFFNQLGGVIPDCKWGAMGPGTAEEVKRRTKKLDFVGTKSSAAEVAKAFSKVINEGSVLFPSAERSLRSIQAGLDKAQVFDLVVYRSEQKRNFDFQETDVLVFTSPSNVEAYCQQYPILPSQNLVSIGPSTSRALQEHGYDNFRQAWYFDEVNLADACW